MAPCRFDDVVQKLEVLSGKGAVWCIFPDSAYTDRSENYIRSLAFGQIMIYCSTIDQIEMLGIFCVQCFSFVLISIALRSWYSSNYSYQLGLVIFALKQVAHNLLLVPLTVS